eukprot:6775274-Alexandrium_andersonii.AAC.1
MPPPPVPPVTWACPLCGWRTRTPLCVRQAKYKHLKTHEPHQRRLVNNKAGATWTTSPSPRPGRQSTGNAHDALWRS